jgi:hypothetical protein
MDKTYNDIQLRAEMQNKLAEAQRREKPSLNGNPLPTSHNVPDYGASGQAMEIAMGQLRESVPNGQKRRTEHAFHALRLAMLAQERWLREKGYDV